MKEYGICDLAFFPLRKEGNHRSEMVSQVLFGEIYSVLEQKDDWMLIELDFDSYQGWIDRKLFCRVSENFLDKYRIEKAVYTTAWYQQTGSKHQFITTGFGSRLPLWDGLTFNLNGDEFFVRGVVHREDTEMNLDELLSIAVSLTGVPYLWGGRSVFGIDCSGFVQSIFKFKSIRLPRDASQQVHNISPKSFAEASKADLCFFSNDRGDITHVGIILEEGKVIHASGKVRIDSIDEKGIYNKDLSEYTHRLHSLRSLCQLSI